MITMETVERRVRKEGSCWIWTGSRAGKPGCYYARFWSDGKSRRLHRWVLEQNSGAAPKDRPWALHRCGVSMCVNPDHLYWGTPTENVADAIAHGKKLARQPRGERSPHAKLSVADVQQIRRRFKRRTNTGDLAREFGVSTSTINRVVTVRTWTEVR